MGTNGFTRIPLARPQRSIAGRIVAVLAGTLVLAAALMFSLLALAVVVVVGVLGLCWLNWKTRHLQRNLREQMRAHAASSPRRSEEQAPHGRVLEGEVIGAAEFEPAPDRNSSPDPDNGGTPQPPRRFKPPARADS